MSESQFPPADPIIFLAAWVGAFDDVFAVVPFALSGEAPAFNLFLRKGRNVDVQQRFEGHASFLDARNQSSGKFGCYLKLEIFKRHKRYGNGGNTEQGTFDSRGNRAGVDDVIAQIWSLVDSGDNQIRANGQEPGQRNFTQFLRGAADGERAGPHVEH